MKDNKLYLEHIVNAFSKISEYIHDIDEDTFMNSDMMQDAVVRKFEIIGEATKRITEDTKKMHSEIPWKYMSGMRDKLIHGYIDIDLWIVFKTAKEDVPILKNQIEKLLLDTA